jgi:hypothetical protein
MVILILVVFAVWNDLGVRRGRHDEEILAPRFFTLGFYPRKRTRFVVIIGEFPFRISSNF